MIKDEENGTVILGDAKVHGKYSTKNTYCC